MKVEEGLVVVRRGILRCGAALLGRSLTYPHSGPMSPYLSGPGLGGLSPATTCCKDVQAPSKRLPGPVFSTRSNHSPRPVTNQGPAVRSTAVMERRILTPLRIQSTSHTTVRCMDGWTHIHLYICTYIHYITLHAVRYSPTLTCSRCGIQTSSDCSVHGTFIPISAPHSTTARYPPAATLLLLDQHHPDTQHHSANFPLPL